MSYTICTFWVHGRQFYSAVYRKLMLAARLDAWDHAVWVCQDHANMNNKYDPKEGRA